MGFNPWNCFGISSGGTCKLSLPWLAHEKQPCHGFNESVILAVANAMASTPLQAAGYEYVSLDCGYSTGFRGADGSLTVNTTRYPHGLKWLGDQIHRLGLKFGMYSDAGKQQCCSRLYGPQVDDGSAGHEAQDAKTFASWGVDCELALSIPWHTLLLLLKSCALHRHAARADLKHDGCGHIASSYPDMRDALNATGRPIVYSIHGLIGVPAVANLWRTTGDISNSWESIVQRALDNDNNRASASPGSWNDPDSERCVIVLYHPPCYPLISSLVSILCSVVVAQWHTLIGELVVLEVGNLWGALGNAEGRSHFSMWSVMKAPLLIGTDVTNMTAETLATLTNPEVIAVNQDPLGIQARLLATANESAIATNRDVLDSGGQVEMDHAVAQWAWALAPTEHTPDDGWTLEANGVLKHAPDGLCLTAQAHGGQPLMLQPCATPGTPTANIQAWTRTSDGNLRLKDRPQECLAMWGGSGPGLVIYSCNTGDNEVFTFNVGTLCSKTKAAPHRTLCLTSNSTKPTKGGGGHHPPSPPLSPVLTWVGELAGGAHVALLVNNLQTTASLSFDTNDLGLSRDAGCFTVREVWTNRTLSQTVCTGGNGTSLRFPAVGAHDCVMLRFNPQKSELK